MEVHDSSSSITCSKSQMRLLNIIRVIKLYPPPPTPTSTREIIDSGHEFEPGSSGPGSANMGMPLDVDLNLRLDLVTETRPESEALSACSVVGGDGVSTPPITAEKHSAGEVPEVQGSYFYEIDQRNREYNLGETAEEEGKKVETPPFPGDEKDSGDFMGLLIEAADMIEKEDRENSTDGNEMAEKTVNGDELMGSGGRRTLPVEGCWGNLGDISPVVRSKRGRNQVLPYRYRDSVLFLEPTDRLPRRRRSAALVSAKPRAR